jgi:hypothetical protein
MDNIKIFDPLHKDNLTKSVASALEHSHSYQLDNIQPFIGSGIYAIYYCGSYQPYDLIGIQNQNRSNPKVPIYVGKAIASNSRSGTVDKKISSKPLFNRLSEHTESIRSASNLDIKDFVCRYLVVDEIWIPLAENLLINKFLPVWNSIVHGFGNHDPGNGRYNGLIPKWDLLHPGREWATRCKPRKETENDIFIEVRQHLTKTMFK